MPPHLPPELVERILLAAFDLPDLTMADARAFCLVSRAFLALAQPMLFASSRCLDTAAKDFNLARFVKRLEPRCRAFITALDLVEVKAEELACLPVFAPTLVWLSVSLSEYTPDQLGNISACVNLERLSFALSPHAFSPIKEVLDALKPLVHLKHLALENLHDLNSMWSIDETQPAHFVPPRLTSLHLAGILGAQASVPFRKAFMTNPHLRLQQLVLELRMFPELQQQIIQAHSRTVHDLAVPFVFDAPRPMDFLSSLPYLSCVYLEFLLPDPSAYLEQLDLLLKPLADIASLPYLAVLIFVVRSDLWEDGECSQAIQTYRGKYANDIELITTLDAALAKAPSSSTEQFNELCSVILKPFEPKVQVCTKGGTWIPLVHLTVRELFHKGEALRRKNEEMAKKKV
ncbi:hypothetical protein JCM10213_003675 [Rhodosporidiobolus nylandii]